MPVSVSQQTTLPACSPQRHSSIDSLRSSWPAHHVAIANGDVFDMTGTGWTYLLILTFVSGVAANGLLVYT